MTRRQSFGYGLILSAVAALTSWAVALWGFHRMYYLAQLLPIFMAFYLLLAWLVHLKSTSFLGFSSRTSRIGGEIPEDRISGAELLGASDGSGLVSRRPDLKDNRAEGFLRNPIPALLWSACQLAILATVLYRALGIGASYF